MGMVCNTYWGDQELVPEFHIAFCFKNDRRRFRREGNNKKIL
jgi:hypothetical protein